MKVRHKVDISATLELTQEEIGALDALFGYGTDAFLKVFYDKLGAAYLKPYEGGIRSLATKVAGCANGMERLKGEAEKVLRGTHRAYANDTPVEEPWRARTRPSHPGPDDSEPALVPREGA